MSRAVRMGSGHGRGQRARARLGAYYPDTLHPDRFILIGASVQSRLLYVVHAAVEADGIRIISARKATQHEAARYEND